MNSSPELVEVETQNRGWAEIEFTPQTMRARWHYVDTVLDRNFAVQSSEPLVCKVGERAFSSS
jgi:alkaline phosphatase D